MKIALRLLLSVFVLAAVVYAATPLWLPPLVGARLPPGWRLEAMQTAYPGLRGIGVRTLSLAGRLPVGDATLSLAGLRLDYRTLKTTVDSLSLELRLADSGYSLAEWLAPGQPLLPLIVVGPGLPELSVRRARASVRHGIQPWPDDPLVVDLQAFELAPSATGGYRLATAVGRPAPAPPAGRFSAELAEAGVRAELRFPADPNTPAWLTLALHQHRRGDGAVTQVRAALDAGAPGEDWLAGVLRQGPGGAPNRLQGWLTAQADFSGQDQQRIDSLSLSAQGLQAAFAGGSLGLDTELLARHTEGGFEVRLPRQTEIRYRGATGLEERLAGLLPGLELAPQASALIEARIAAGSSLVVRPGGETPVQFEGGAALDISAAGRVARLQARELRAAWAELSASAPAPGQAAGRFEVHWQESSPLRYAGAGRELRADGLSLDAAGSFGFDQGRAGFSQSGSLEILRPALVAAGDGQQPPLALDAGKLSVRADATLRDGRLLSSGAATVTQGRSGAPAVSAERLEVEWRDFDLFGLNGSLGARSNGLAADLGARTWTGCDLEATFELRAGAGVEGSGHLLFDAGPRLPFGFRGDVPGKRWNLSLPATTIGAAELASIQRAIGGAWPDGFKLTGGRVEVEGAARIGDEIDAELAVRGDQLGADLLKNSVRGARFGFEARYAGTLSVSGPVSIDSATLAGGVRLSELAAAVSLEYPETLQLQDLQAALFGGSLRLERLLYANGGIEDTTLALTGIRLDRLLAFLDIDGLQGSGDLDASLPVGSDAAGLHIRNGVFQSTGPGRIAYAREGLAEGNIGLQALKNFQYTSLSGTLAYQSHGDYQVGIRLEGKNPDLYGGHAIIFRLSINGSLPELFEALFMTGDFEESILKEIRSH